MLKYNVKTPDGDFSRLNTKFWRSVAPSVLIEEAFDDGSANVFVLDAEADNLTDCWDEGGLEYTLI